MYEFYSQCSDSYLKCELSELAENGLTGSEEYKTIKQILSKRYPIE